MIPKQYKNIPDYIRSSPAATQPLLKQMRKSIQAAAPKAEETIKYGMPTYVLGKNLVHFAAMKNHIGFYPAPSAIVKFKKELTAFVTSKGAIQFPMDKPLPLTLITKIVKFRVKENLAKLRLAAL